MDMAFSNFEKYRPNFSVSLILVRNKNKNNSLQKMLRDKEIPLNLFVNKRTNTNSFKLF